MVRLPQILVPEGMSELVFSVLIATSFIGSLITVALGIGGGACCWR